LFPLNELHRACFVGDWVVILAGLHKGQAGSILHEENGLLQILIATDDVVNK
jgi:ribosomal protein L24